jgi:hypothetical protein
VEAFDLKNRGTEKRRKKEAPKKGAPKKRGSKKRMEKLLFCQKNLGVGCSFWEVHQ